MTAGEREPAPAHPLGLLRIQNSFVVSAPRWIQPSEQGVEIGALATGEGDITDVGDDVSARHAISGAMLKISGTSRTCRPPTEPWW